MTSQPDTYYYVATFEADSPDEAFEVANGRDLDPPTEVPTVAELRERIRSELNGFMLSLGLDPELGDPELPVCLDSIIEIVTLGNVPAGSES